MAVPPRLRDWRRARTRHTPVAEQVSLGAQDLLYREEISGLVLIASAAAAVALASCPWRATLEGIWTSHLSIDLGLVRIEESVRDWINHLLMALFFLGVVGWPRRHCCSSPSRQAPRRRGAGRSRWPPMWSLRGSRVV